MTVNVNTLDRIQSLARLYQVGYHSNTVDATIKKLVDIERSRLETEAKNLQNQLGVFEQRYDLSSEDFFKRFRAGTMGDDADMFEWSAFYQMEQTVKSQLEALNP